MIRRLPCLALLVVLGAGGWPGSLPAAQASEATAHVTPVDYHGWTGALRLQNATAEVIAVPEIGRVMSFRFRDGANVLWEDESLRGRRGAADGSTWVNFGGDKTWPAPEAEWKNYTGYRQWMPPPAFDGLPVAARSEPAAIVLTSPVDRFYGIRTVRRVTLRADEPILSIETTYERVSGSAGKVSIWVITQFRDPIAVYLPIPSRSQFPDGHFRFRDGPWPQVTRVDRMLKLTRDPSASRKLGSDADRMLWIGADAMCLVATNRTDGAEYPDRGASAEVYTNQNPKTYVELETLGPLVTLRPGERISQTNTYTLLRRQRPGDPDADARVVLYGQ